MRRTEKSLSMKQIRTGVRKDDCCDYDTCLRAASAMNYSGFSCEGCKVYKPTKQGQPERQARIFTPLAVNNWI